MRKLIYSFIVSSFFILLVIASCKKDSGPADAVITVIDTLERPVINAKVVLRQDSVVNPNTGVKANIHQESFTDGAGQAYFSFDKEAVLNVECSKDSMFGRDYIRLEQASTVSKTVKIK